MGRGGAGQQTGQQFVPQVPDVAVNGVPPARRGFESRRHADDPGHVVGTGPSLSFLGTTVQERLQLNGPA